MNCQTAPCLVFHALGMTLLNEGMELFLICKEKYSFRFRARNNRARTRKKMRITQLMVYFFKLCN